jgi:hypothetical protein
MICSHSFLCFMVAYFLIREFGYLMIIICRMFDVSELAIARSGLNSTVMIL